MIKALMIDVDGVLVNGRPSDGRHWAVGMEADLNLSFASLQEAFFDRHWAEIVTGQADLRDRLAEVLARIAPALTAEQVMEYWFNQDSALNDTLLADLKLLRKQSYLVYLATNQEYYRMCFLQRTLGLEAYVDGCYYSAEIGYRKPTSGFFNSVTASVDLPASALLLVDDAEDNVRAALQSGWRAVQWTGRERLPDILARDAGLSWAPSGI